uniref:Nuclear factor 7, ovary-like n=1 Tax=Scleropages formosus TaxID=113540 RepID=A0A8D0CF15_SCLFO
MDPNISSQNKETICSEIFKDPVKLKCSHMSRESCLMQHGEQKLECQECLSYEEGSVAQVLLDQASKGENNDISMAQSEPFCSTHGETHLLFCKDDEKLICTECSDKHRYQQTCSVGEAAQQMKEHLEKTVKPIKTSMQEKANQEYKEIAERMKIQAQDTEQEIKEEFKKIQNFLEEAKLRALKEAKKDITEKMKENIKNISKDISMMSKEIEDTEKELDGHDIAFLKNFKTIKERVQSKLQDPERFSGRFTVVSNHIAEVKSLSSRVQQIIMQDINPDHMEKTGDQTGGSDLTAGKSSVQMDSVNKQTMNTKQLKSLEDLCTQRSKKSENKPFSISRLNSKPPQVKVHIAVSGPTLNSHQTFMKKLDMSLEECSLKNCSVILIFCPIVTRMGTDVDTGVKSFPGEI